MEKNTPTLVLFKDLNTDDGKKTDAVNSVVLEMLEVLSVFWLLFPTSCVEKLNLLPSVIRLARGI